MWGRRRRDVVACPGGREEISWKKSAQFAKKQKFLPGNLLNV
jgi:hypothetical protein